MLPMSNGSRVRGRVGDAAPAPERLLERRRRRRPTSARLPDDRVRRPDEHGRRESTPSRPATDAGIRSRDHAPSRTGAVSAPCRRAAGRGVGSVCHRGAGSVARPARRHGPVRCSPHRPQSGCRTRAGPAESRPPPVRSGPTRRGSAPVGPRRPRIAGLGAPRAPARRRAARGPTPSRASPAVRHLGCGPSRPEAPRSTSTSDRPDASGHGRQHPPGEQPERDEPDDAAPRVAASTPRHATPAEGGDEQPDEDDEGERVPRVPQLDPLEAGQPDPPPAPLPLARQERAVLTVRDRHLPRRRRRTDGTTSRTPSSARPAPSQRPASQPAPCPSATSRATTRATTDAGAGPCAAQPIVAGGQRAPNVRPPRGGGCWPRSHRS